MSLPDFQQNYFQLFGLPVSFALQPDQLGQRYRQLQAELHPDRYAAAPVQEQRLAVQYSALVNEAYATLRKPLTRAIYLLGMVGIGEEQVAAQQIDGGFLIMQMELREKLESLDDLVEPELVLEHLLTEINGDMTALRAEFAQAYGAGDFETAAGACVKMQYLDKLLREAEQAESDLLDQHG
jgi:molecular chaperone HscB